MSHPNCTNGHLCQRPNGHLCIEPDCNQPAGTLWGPLWCPDHDRERLDRVSRQMESLLSPAADVVVPQQRQGGTS